jgi:hypothetical protein
MSLRTLIRISVYGKWTHLGILREKNFINVWTKSHSHLMWHKPQSHSVYRTHFRIKPLSHFRWHRTLHWRRWIQLSPLLLVQYYTRWSRKYMLLYSSWPCFFYSVVWDRFSFTTHEKNYLYTCGKQRWSHKCSFHVHRHKNIFRVYSYFWGVREV